MRKRNYAAAICAAVLMWPALQAHAQRMYRCGNAYQDRPCEGAQAGKEVRDFSGAAAPGSKVAADAQCARTGEEALKIVWARESGVTREQQLASRPQDQWLIETVYMKRGSAPEIRAGVEAACMAEKERQAAVLAATAARIHGTATVPPPSSQGPSDAELARMRERQDADIAASQEAFKKKRCADLSRQSDDLRKQERIGGSSATLRRLYELRTSVDETRRREGC